MDRIMRWCVPDDALSVGWPTPRGKFVADLAELKRLIWPEITWL